MTLCEVCGKELEEGFVFLGLPSHPPCIVAAMTSAPMANPFMAPGDSPIVDIAEDLKAEFTTMIRWHEEFAPRTMQVALGPSDLGTECDRRLAYKIAGIAGFNRGDPWAAFVGSAIHTRIEGVIRKYAKEHGGTWLIEERIVVTPEISGRADLIRDNMVIDIKSASPDVIKKLPDTGPRGSYLPQIHSYAWGLNQAGHRIDKVAFVFVPRSGRLDDMWVWVDAYRPEIAEAALKRVYGFARRLGEMDILNNPHLWETVPATPDYMWCQFCPLMNRGMSPDEPATDKGCPGYKMNRKEKK